MWECERGPGAGGGGGGIIGLNSIYIDATDDSDVLTCDRSELALKLSMFQSQRQRRISRELLGI